MGPVGWVRDTQAAPVEWVSPTPSPEAPTSFDVFTIKVKPRYQSTMKRKLSSGFFCKDDGVITKINKGSIADKAGLRVDDEIYKIKPEYGNQWYSWPLPPTKKKAILGSGKAYILKVKRW